jgi:hypothetical protein
VTATTSSEIQTFVQPVEERAVMVLPNDAHVRAGRSRVLARMATTGIYLLRGLPRDLQRAARARALAEGTTLHSVLLQGLREYAAGTWTPRSDA